MNYIFPDYYQKFSCIAGKCPASCCITDWEIEIDPETREYYEEVEEPVGDKIRSLMIPCDDADSGEGSAVIRASSDRRCPFLDKNNLCELILALGEDGLSQTCREYPRYFGESGDIIQEDLSLSCPEAARLFFSDKNPIQYRTDSDIMDGEPLSEKERKKLSGVIAFRDRALSDPIRSVSDMEQAPLPAKRLIEILKETESLGPFWDEALRCVTKAARSFPAVKSAGALPAWALAKLTQYFVFRYSIDVMYGATFENVMNLTRTSLAAMGLLFVSEWEPSPDRSCRKIPGTAGRCSDEQIRLMDVAVLYSRQMEHSEENIEILARGGKN